MTYATVIFDAGTKTKSNMLRILDTAVNSTRKNEVHVCVKPIHSSYSQAKWLVEWFELNILMGVSHFYVYNESMADNVSCVLDHYRRLGLVTLLPWNLPISPKSIHAEGQAAAFNDCLYRSMFQVEWLLIIDFDELVFPRPKRPLLHHFETLSYKANKEVSALIFRNGFFLMDFGKDAASEYPLVTSRRTRRLARVQGHWNRSKYVTRPQDSIELGNHFVWEFTLGHKAHYAKRKMGFLHHYREKCPWGPVCRSSRTKLDNWAVQWARELYPRVKMRRQLLSSCLPPLEEDSQPLPLNKKMISELVEFAI